MQMDLADLVIIVPARLGSKRVPSKMLKPFAGTTLFDICLKKLESLRDIVYAAVWEPELIAVAKQHGIKVIKRSEESAKATVGLSAHGPYLKAVRQETVMFVSACQPLLSRCVLHRAVKTVLQSCERGTFRGLVGVYPKRCWAWNTHGNIVNADPEVNDSQAMKPIWVFAGCPCVFNRTYYLSTGQYWDFTRSDLTLFPIDKEETVDVDTIQDFELAEHLWKRKEERNG